MRTLFIVLFLCGFARANPNKAFNRDNCGQLSAIEPFTIDRFLKTIKLKNIDGVEKALCLIPKSIAHNAVLVNNSLSLQNGTLLYPRAIMFDPGSPFEPVKFAISFNGHLEQKQYASLEIISFDPNAQVSEQMTFFDAHFDDIKKSVTITKNPQSCLACHSFNTTIPRPLWDANLFFSNAYGFQRSDEIKDLDENFISLSRQFFESYQNHPRYRFIGPIEAKVRTWRNEADLNKDIQFRRASILPFYEVSVPTLQERNNNFAIRLAILNRRRIAKLIYDSIDYEKYRYAISSVLLGCSEPVIDLIPSSRLAQFSSRNGTPEIFHEVDISDATIDKVFEEKNINFVDPAKFNKKYKEFLDTINHDPKYLPLLPYYIDTHLNEAQWFAVPFKLIGQLRWLFEGRGLSMQTWNMDSTYFSQGFYRFINHPETNTFEFNKFQDLQVVLLELIKIDPTLNFIFRPEASQMEFASHLSKLNNPQLCTKLKNLSLKELKE